ncbi:MAG: preprotein translocase subunit SecG [Magnetococcales bacterium]|nr:preprotein translocase subunit SecG [Magnetococcales bacterium]
MALILTVLHILVSIALVFVVLLQKGGGADMGAAFGGTSQSLFGAGGSGNFLSKLTATLATIFMLTSLTLAFFTTHRDVSSVMDQAPATQSRPAVPAKEAESGPPVPAKSGSAAKPAAEAPRDATAPVPEAAKPVPPPPDAPKKSGE